MNEIEKDILEKYGNELFSYLTQSLDGYVLKEIDFRDDENPNLGNLEFSTNLSNLGNYFSLNFDLGNKGSFGVSGHIYSMDTNTCAGGDSHLDAFINSCEELRSTKRTLEKNGISVNFSSADCDITYEFYVFPEISPKNFRDELSTLEKILKGK